MKTVKLLMEKEIKMAISPWTYLFFLCAAMLLIPQYPYWVGMFYCLMAVQINFTLAQTNKDHSFTACLPVKRTDIVLIKILALSYIELLQIIVAIPLAILTNVINPTGNPIGMDANLSFFGFVILAYAVFNLIFLTQYFKTGYKVGFFLVLAMLSWFAVAGVVEVIVNVIPGAQYVFDGRSAETLLYRIITLVACIGAYAGIMAITFKKSVKNFKNVSI